MKREYILLFETSLSRIRNFLIFLFPCNFRHYLGLNKTLLCFGSKVGFWMTFNL